MWRPGCHDVTRISGYPRGECCSQAESNDLTRWPTVWRQTHFRYVMISSLRCSQPSGITYRPPQRLQSDFCPSHNFIVPPSESPSERLGTIETRALNLRLDSSPRSPPPSLPFSSRRRVLYRSHRQLFYQSHGLEASGSNTLDGKRKS